MTFQYSWLRSFHFTAQLGSITKASDYLNLSNSTLSHQIKALETNFKVKLFYRSGNKIYLTNIGLSLKKITDRYFNHEQTIKAFLGKVRNRVNKVLNIGAENPMKVIPLMSLISPTEKKKGSTRFNLFFEKNDLLMEMFIKNKVDVLAINKFFFETYINSMTGQDIHEKNYEQHPTIDSLPFYTDRLTLAVNEKHPQLNFFMRKDNVWEKIMEGRIILSHKSYASRIYFDRLCRKLRIFPHNIMEISSREGVITAVKSNLGIGVVLESEIIGRTEILSLPIPIKKLSSNKSVMGLIEESDILVEEYVYFNHNIADLTLIKKFIELIKNYNLEKEMKEFNSDTEPS